VFFLSCDNKRVYDSYQSIPKKWHKDSVVSFNLEAPDTTRAYNLFVNLRNNHEYPYNNLFLITKIIFPHGKTIKDTLEYKMAAPDGKLLGTGFSDIKENKLWFKGFNTPFVFKEPGTYTVEIQHAMRQNGEVEGLLYLEGINDVGLRVESTN
jgi:gliding motility-associated lipoprotein GldH